MDPAAPEHDRGAAALRLLASSRGHLLRIAGRVSLCADDAEDALGRAVEILLTRAPALDRGRLLAWMTVVTRREALAVRRSRERLLAAGPRLCADGSILDPLEQQACAAPGPAERAERSERVAEVRGALAELKPAERAAIWLQAEGYSYAEIADLHGWTYTKVNRSLAEGRTKLRARA